MKIYDSEFLEMDIDADKKLSIATWKPFSENLTSELYKNEMVNFANLMVKYSLELNLVDTQKFLFIITTDVQDWIVKNVFPLLDKVRKTAFVVSEDIFAQISVNQAMDDAPDITSAYFDSLEDAKKWILS